MVWILFGKLRNVICDFSPCVFFGRFIHLFNVLSETKKIWYDKLMSKRSWNQHNVFKDQPVSKQINPLYSCKCIKFIELKAVSLNFTPLLYTYSLNSDLPMTSSVMSWVVSIWFWYFCIFWTISFNLGSDVGLKPVLSKAYNFIKIPMKCKVFSGKNYVAWTNHTFKKCAMAILFIVSVSSHLKTSNSMSSTLAKFVGSISLKDIIYNLTRL